jgi:hypothetical protein
LLLGLQDSEIRTSQLILMCFDYRKLISNMHQV